MAKINSTKKKLSSAERNDLLSILKTRFEKNMKRHKGIAWPNVQAALVANPDNLWSIAQMEKTGGEPDVILLTTTTNNKKADEYLFCDCSAESPKGRRSICYDHEALESRKENKPSDSAINMAAEMGIEILTEEQYRELQKLESFDTKTSSWISTPAEIRKREGTLFCDRRYDTVFVYHNGAESYYAARAFRGLVKV